MKLYDGGTIIIIAVGLMFLSICHEIQEAKRDREFWKYIEQINNCRVSSDKPLQIKKATPEDIERFWNGEDIEYGFDN